MRRARDPDAIRAAMAARDLTYRELALLADCAKGTVGFMLRGRPIDPDLARRIAGVLRHPVGKLFQTVESSTEQAVDQSVAVA